ncbi:hypothetical protein OF83DRAFT_1269662 [Amylostereum chailletii]|nr:hypothetical protein OF83DRAFT_1269662 [Amylostereum chailletii]
MPPLSLLVSDNADAGHQVSQQPPLPVPQTPPPVPQTPPPIPQTPPPVPQTPSLQPQTPDNQAPTIIPPGIPGLHTTPVHYKADGYTRFSSRQVAPGRDEQYVNQAEEMNYRFVGPCPFSDFFASFLPEAPTSRPSNDVWDAAVASATGKEVDRLVHTINESGVCGTLRAWNTESKAADDGLSSRRADMNLFDLDVAAEAIPTAEEIWRQNQIWGEGKPADHDPFVDPTSLVGRKDKDFQHGKNQECNKARGQMVAYAIAQFSAQHRVFAFSFVTVGRKVRVIRWDRSGAVVTEAVDWRSNPDTFAEFLWRFNFCDSAERGHDLTICAAPQSDEVKRARAAFKKLKTHKVAEDAPLQRVVIHDEATNKDHALIIAGPQCRSISLVGSATLCYAAVDVHDGKLVWLKDCWRIDSPEHMKESDVYQKLADNNIPYTARKVYSGDVEGQFTRTQDFVTKPWACKTSKEPKRVRNRLVTNKIGRSLSGFMSERQLCVVLRDCIHAHWLVFKILGILHRDVSAANILIDEDGRGLLIDWGLARVVRVSPPAGPVTARFPFRSGVWQFTSALLLWCAGKKPHLLCDDLESFFHVLTFEVLRYRPSRYSTSRLVGYVKETYDSSIYEDSPRKGSEKKWGIIAGNHPRIKFVNSLHPSCTKLLEAFRVLFRDSLPYDAIAFDLIPMPLGPPAILSTSLPVLKIFDHHLADPAWVEDINTRSVDQLRYAPVVEDKAPNMKRYYKAADSDAFRDWHDKDSHHTDEPSAIRKRRRVQTQNPSARGDWVPVSGTGTGDDDSSNIPGMIDWNDTD